MKGKREPFRYEKLLTSLHELEDETALKSVPSPKEDERVLQFAGGNLMQLHLRDIIDESVKDLLRFFTAIPTLEDLQRELRGKPLRRVDYDCKLPDFCDLQDHVQPLFKLVLDARSGSSIDDSMTLAFEEDDGTIL